MRVYVLFAVLALVAAITVAVVAHPVHAATPAADRRARGLAAFETMASVMTSPRCQNCHTVTTFPRQGDDRHPHRFNVMRGPDGHGSPGLPCSTCHGRANNISSGVPGADEAWGIAPLSMGWEGLSRGDLCRHLKDPSRNGHRTGSQVIDHLKTHLVRWAWSPGADAHGRPRNPPPVGYGEFLKAAQTWVRDGEACPADVK